jgi:hypothetical protein
MLVFRHPFKTTQLALALLLVVILGGLSISTAVAGDPVIVAAGDIACDPTDSGFNGGAGISTRCRMLATSNLILNINPAAVLPVGDTQYYCGGYTAFLESYDLSWGRFKAITHPVVGNHEYLTSGGTGCDKTNAGAAGYFKYYGSLAGPSGEGYYSYDVGTWHLIALNSNCGDVGGCSASSPQGEWLQSDLAAHLNQCILAYWHIPLWSSGGRASTNSLPLMQQLYNAGADVVLTGHDHDYERFAPQDYNGNLDTTRGIREFVAGTGGSNHTSFTTIAKNSEVRNDTTFGVLKLTLHPASYDWTFVPETAGGFTDSGSNTCHHGSPTPTPTNTATRTATSTPTRTATFTPTALVPTNTPTIAASTSIPITPSPTATRRAGGKSDFIFLPFVAR